MGIITTTTTLLLYYNHYRHHHDDWLWVMGRCDRIMDKWMLVRGGRSVACEVCRKCLSLRSDRIMLKVTFQENTSVSWQPVLDMCPLCLCCARRRSHNVLNYILLPFIIMPVALRYTDSRSSSSSWIRPYSARSFLVKSMLIPPS
jgi:hypothetical protein